MSAVEADSQVLGFANKLNLLCGNFWLLCNFSPHPQEKDDVCQDLFSHHSLPQDTFIAIICLGDRVG